MLRIIFGIYLSFLAFAGYAKEGDLLNTLINTLEAVRDAENPIDGVTGVIDAILPGAENQDSSNSQDDSSFNSSGQNWNNFQSNENEEAQNNQTEEKESPKLTREEFLAQLKNGEVEFKDGSCGFSWGYNKGNILSMLSRGAWTELALELNEHQCPQDLSYYFLGRAAEGLGHKKAAMKYYAISVEYAKIDDALYACNNVFEINCWDFNPSKDSQSRFDALAKSLKDSTVKELIADYKDMNIVIEVNEAGAKNILEGKVSGIKGKLKGNFEVANNDGRNICSGSYDLTKEQKMGDVTLSCFGGGFKGDGKISFTFDPQTKNYKAESVISNDSAILKVFMGPGINKGML